MKIQDLCEAINTLVYIRCKLQSDPSNDQTNIQKITTNISLLNDMITSLLSRK